MYEDFDTIEMKWPAQMRFCVRLGIPAWAMPEEGTSTHVRRRVITFLFHKPWLAYRLLPAYMEYCDCRLHMSLLQREANRIRTSSNNDLVDHILSQTGLHLIRESQRDWSELCGLASQKLMHLRYHEDMKKSIFR